MDTRAHVDLDGAPRTGVVLRMQRGAEVGGLVVDSAGRPVRGASVRVAWTRIDTGDDGTFSVRGLDPGEVEVSASTERMGARVQQVTLERAKPTRVTLVLEPSSFAGVVRDAYGPVPGAWVWAREKVTNERLAALTSDDGTFDFGGVPPGAYDIGVERESAPGGDRKPLATIRAPRTDLVLAIPLANAIAGRVTLDGRAVTYFGVELVPAGETSGGAVMTVHEPDGAFFRADLPDGAWDVVIVGPGFERAIQRVQVHGGLVDLGEIAVERGRSIAGRVVDARGEPIAGALVAMRTTGSRGSTGTRALFEGTRTARTDAAGRYEIVGLDREDVIRAQASHARGVTTEVIVDPGVRHLDFTIAPAGSIVGRIAGHERQHAVYARPLSADLDGEYEALIDGGGGFELRGLPADEYEVRVFGHDDFTRRVRVEAGRETRLDFGTPDP